VALNLQTNDLPTQLHHALFEHSEGYVLKPCEMRSTQPWPPPSVTLGRVTLRILSLHGLPRPEESRPRYEGQYSRCHEYVPELSGPLGALPLTGSVSSPQVSVELLPIGGTCCVAHQLPPNRRKRLHTTRCRPTNGLNPRFDETVHCLAQAPNETVVRIAVLDQGEEVAYETAMLGTLRSGYRVFHLRSPFGTRIEACYLFVCVSKGVEPNPWASSEHFQAHLGETERRMKELQEQLLEQQARKDGLLKSQEEDHADEAKWYHV